MDTIHRRGFLAVTAGLLMPRVSDSAPVPLEPKTPPAIVPNFREPPLPEGAFARLGSARFRISEENTELRLSADGRYLATGGIKATKIWDTATGICVVDFADFDSQLRQYLSVHDFDAGQMLCSTLAFNLRTLHRLELPSGRIVASFEKGYVWAGPVADRGGKRMLMVTETGVPHRLECLDCATGAMLWSKESVLGRHSQFDFSEDGTRAVIADTRLTVVDARTGAVIREFEPDGTPALSRAGHLVADYSGIGPTVRVRSVASGRTLWWKGYPDEIVALRYLPDDSALLLALKSGLLLLDPRSGHTRRRFSGIRTKRFEVSRDSKTVIVETVLGGLVFLDLGTGEHLPQSTDPPGNIEKLEFLSNRRLAGGAYGFQSVWDTGTRAIRTVIGEGVAIAPDGIGHAIAGPNSVSIFDGIDPKSRCEIPIQGVERMKRVNDKTLVGIRFDEFIIFSSNGRTERRISAVGREFARHFIVGADRKRIDFFWIEFLNDSRTTFVQHRDRYDIATGQVVRSKLDSVRWQEHASVSGDGRVMVAREQEGTFPVIVRDGVTGVVQTTLEDVVEESPYSVSPDGRTLAVWRIVMRPGPLLIIGEEEDLVNAEPETAEELQLIEVATGGVRHRFAQVTPPRAFAFSPDGRTLASAHEDAPVFLWDIYGERTNSLPKPDAAGLRAAWVDLAFLDAERAFRAMCMLIQNPAVALPMLAHNMKPVAALKPGRIREAIAELADRDYRTREAAERELADIADEVRMQLRAAYDAGTGSAEADERLERLIDPTNATPRIVRCLRAHELLERIGTPAAKDVVKASAKGSPDAIRTKDAMATLARW